MKICVPLTFFFVFVCSANVASQSWPERPCFSIFSFLPPFLLSALGAVDTFWFVALSCFVC
ncbi:MAG: hypothetical protein BYD32DRAFT_428029 [Podila humilis]|nr:MAG: hypothetical protein BYD32DRAFT_428029 [Podila humilis]